MTLPFTQWPYLPTLLRLGLALAVGLFIGVERERRGKESGLRTFAFTALLGGIGGLLGDMYAIVALLLIGLLVVFLNVNSLRSGHGVELTTSATLLLTGFAGVLCGQGHTLTPSALAVIIVALLAWKEPLAGFSIGLSEVELRSAILLAILAIVIYPALPEGAIDPWGAVEPRTAWVTVILIAGLGFINYILWKIYGSRGVELTGFLGGLINSSIVISALAVRVRETQGQLREPVYRGMLLAVAAMAVRNAVLLALLAPVGLAWSALAFGLMLLTTLGLAFLRHPRSLPAEAAGAPALNFTSPFSLQSALKFGLLLLIIQVAGILAQLTLGHVGIYAVSFFGGLISSASAVAAAATLGQHGTITAQVAGICAVLASLASVGANLPFIISANDRALVRRLAWSTGIIALAGVVGLGLQVAFWPAIQSIVAAAP
ncbi:MAG: MgtC/SapB family protein [Anaerolineales bacterium]|nr:MgtC/SapB family protein [Anaerolineales bacterium]